MQLRRPVMRRLYAIAVSRWLMDMTKDRFNETLCLETSCETIFEVLVNAVQVSW